LTLEQSGSKINAYVREPIDRQTTMRKFLSIVGYTLFFVAIVNFTVFWVVGVWVGGDAISGKVQGGHYYVSSHGRLTEVSPRIWQYSRIHAMSVWITHPLGILGGCGLMALSERLGAKKPQKRKPAFEVAD
jgi:hypothetical protein